MLPRGWFVRLGPHLRALRLAYLWGQKSLKPTGSKMLFSALSKMYFPPNLTNVCLFSFCTNAMLFWEIMPN